MAKHEICCIRLHPNENVTVIIDRLCPVILQQSYITRSLNYCVYTAKTSRRVRVPPNGARRGVFFGGALELLLLLEEQAEADDGSVDQQATYDRHDHGLELDEIGVCENDRQGCNTIELACTRDVRRGVAGCRHAQPACRDN